MLFDTHAHLDDSRFDSDRDELIEKIHSEGISLIVNPGADIDSSKRAIDLAARYDFIYATVGVHPHDAKDLKEEDFEKIEEMAKADKVVAIGEIGLDYYYDNSPREIQKQVFIRQIEIANRLGLPIVIHSRDASQDTYDIIKKYKKDDIGCLLHCYGQSLEMAELYIEMGCYISFAGPLTFKNSHKLKEIARSIPLEKILIETDAPYLTPEPFRGKRNDPSKVRYVALELAKLRNIDPQQAMEITMKNGLEFFSIKL